MKKLLLPFVLMLLPIVACADAVEIDGIYYNLVSKVKQAEVTSNPNKYKNSVEIPPTVTYNGIEYNVTSIGVAAFDDCRSLTSVTIPNSVTSIGRIAFRYCDRLTSVHISDLAAWCNISFDYESANPLYYAHRLFLNGTEVTNLVIPNSVTSIGYGAFYGCSGLTSITIPNSVTSIGRDAFRGCSGLTSVTIPNSVTSIDFETFRDCSGLTSVTIPNSVTTIDQWAFLGCSGLTSITIPNSVTSIGYSAFSGCSGLTSVTIPNSVTSIGDWAFGNCSGLTSVTIPNSVTSIGICVFHGCSGLTSVTIPNSVASIGNSAFSDCSGLTTLKIGSGVKSIDKQAFANCPEITDVYCFAENVPSTNTTAFEGSYPDYATLHVPQESITAYKATEPWSSFGTIKTIEGGDIVETPKCATPIISYGGKRLFFYCDTEDVEYVYEIKDTDIKKGYDAIVNLSATYEISVYATKSGFEDSDLATAILVWTNATFTETTPTPEIATSAKMVEESIPVLISANNRNITVKSEANGQAVAAYSADGQLLGNATVQNGQATISTKLGKGSVAIVKLGEKAVKIVMQ